MLRDLRYAFAQLIRRPAFAAAAVLTLALGIGANTAVFSAVYAVLLAKPPFAKPDELQQLSQRFDTADGTAVVRQDWSYPEYETLRDAAPDLQIAAYTPYALPYNLATPEQPAPARAEIVSASYFGVLGVPAQRGRTFAPTEDAIPGTHPVAVIGDRVWQSGFGGDPGIIGRTIRLNGVVLEVVGVMPPGFAGLSGEADVWVPMMMAPTLVFANRLTQTRAFWHSVIARIPADETALAATALTTAGHAISVELAAPFGGADVELSTRPLVEARVDRRLGGSLLMLLAAVGCVLLIACVNLANLLLARGARRARELGLRMALGASSRRLFQHAVAEAVVLGALGGGAAILVATWGLELTRRLDPGVLSAHAGIEPLSLSLPVLAFNGLATGLAVLAFGTAPAIVATRGDARSLLHGTASGRRRAGPRAALVVTEVAVATVLLVGAGLLLRNLDRLQSTPLGFRPDNVFAAYVNVPTQVYTTGEAVALLTETTRRIASSSGVDQAAVATCLPANPSAGPVTGQCDHVRMSIRDDASAGSDHGVWMNMVSADYFSTLGIPVVAGRPFDADDRAGVPAVAVLTQSAADRYWPGKDPVGQSIRLTAGPEDWAEVVGVVGDALGPNPREPDGPGVYLSFAQFAYESNYIVLRSAGDPGRSAGLVRSVLSDIDPGLPLWDVATMNERLSRAMARDRFGTVLVGVFGALALLLAAVGIYGVLAFLVAERTREVGIRMAIGATGRDVAGQVVREGLRFTMLGLGAGLSAAALLAGLLRSRLYLVSALDPATFVAAAIVLVSVAAIACLLPSRRAAGVDPMAALRDD